MKSKLRTMFSHYQEPLYIGAFSSCIGNSVHEISELNRLSEDEKLLDFLTNMGLHQYRSSEMSPAQLAYESAKNTITKSGLEPSDIDAVIYVTESLWCTEWYSTDHNHLLEKLHLENSYMIGTFLRGCSNIHTALRIASNMCITNETSNVLIITSDQAENDDLRLVPPNIGVTSDGAASFILSKSVEISEFRILCNSQSAIPSMYKLDESVQYMKFMKCIGDGLSACVNRCTDETKIMLNDMKYFVMNNYNKSVVNMFSSIIEASEEKFVTDNISRYGHCYSSDNVLNIMHLIENNNISSGEMIMNISSGPASWGSSILVKE